MADFDEPLDTQYGHQLKLGHSSAAMYDAMWLWVDCSKSQTKGAANGFDGTLGVHMTMDQVVALRDRLSAWITTITGYDDMLVTALRAQLRQREDELRAAAELLSPWRSEED